ncbi:MAG: hypothetical protein LKI93_03850 [Bifidobacteriaceae bacterium]|jgi:hypothetical protein|nr:hypothetical protein [Bifidobacteriaceae bacterium]MCI1914411.1 hypothetical protein [Bifidobacteriaceae bacterium]MCI1935863.1 hypothetical protein [Bifidobacteriaceae bacterium]
MITDSDIAQRTQALHDAAAENMPLIRASMLQYQLGGLDTPLAFFAEENGYDLHAVQWQPAEDGNLAFDYTHLQYDDTSGLPEIHVISATETPEIVRPLGVDDHALMEMSRQLVDRYQQIRYPDPAMSRPVIRYTQTGLLHPGETPHLAVPTTGELAPDWERLVTEMPLNTETKEKKMEDTTTGIPTPQDGSEPDRNRKSESWPRVNMPNGYVHPYTMTAKDGRQFDKMIVNIPAGVKLNGVDVGGWSLDRFMSKEARTDKANGRAVTLSFKPDTEIELFKGKGEKQQKLKVQDPWILCKAVKTAREEYAQQHAKTSNAPQKKEEQVQERDAERHAREAEVGDEAPSAAIGRDASGDHVDMSGKTFTIPYEVNDETRYATAMTNGASAWNLVADEVNIGRIDTSSEGYYIAFSQNRPEGISTLDPVSAARQVVKDALISTRVPGEIRQSVRNTAVAIPEPQPEQREVTDFDIYHDGVERYTEYKAQGTAPGEWDVRNPDGESIAQIAERGDSYTVTMNSAESTTDTRVDAASIIVRSTDGYHPGDAVGVSQETPAPVRKDKRSFLEKMQDVTKEYFSGKKFGDDVTQNLNRMSKEDRHGSR